MPLHPGLDPATRQSSTHPTNRVFVDRLDRIIVTGVKVGPATSRCTLLLQRFLPSGVVDATFGSEGLVRVETDTYRDTWAREVYLNERNEILAVVSDSTKTVMYKLDEDGKIDSTYGENGSVKIADLNWHLYVNMHADGHEVYMVCHFTIPKTGTARTTLLHISSDGVVRGDSTHVPYYYAQIVADEGGVFLCYERTIEKWTRQGVIDSSFGDAGRVKWQERSGASNIYAAYSVDANTIACFGLEEERGPAISRVESFVVFVDTRDGRIIRHVHLPFNIWGYPRSWMRFANIGDDGVVTFGGFHTRDTIYTSSLEFFRYDASDKPDLNFFEAGRFLLSPKAPDSSARIEGMAVLSNNDVVFLESTRMLGRLFVKTTSVDEQIETPSAAVVAFPNPTSGRIEFSTTADLMGCTYTITSMTGQNLESGILSNSMAIEIPTFIPSGTYGLHLSLSSGATVTLNVVLIR